MYLLTFAWLFSRIASADELLVRHSQVHCQSSGSPLHRQPSNSVSKITSGFIELSGRAEKRGRKAVVKLLIDRGDIKQSVLRLRALTPSLEHPRRVINPHVRVPPSAYDELDIPKKEDIAWIDLEVQNCACGALSAAFLTSHRS